MTTRWAGRGGTNRVVAGAGVSVLLLTGPLSWASWADPTPGPTATATAVDDFCMLESNYYGDPRCAGYAGAHRSAGQRRSLPFTGEPSDTIVGAGAASVAAGALLMALGRRRRRA